MFSFFLDIAFSLDWAAPGSRSQSNLAITAIKVKKERLRHYEDYWGGENQLQATLGERRLFGDHAVERWSKVVYKLLRIKSHPCWLGTSLGQTVGWEVESFVIFHCWRLGGHAAHKEVAAASPKASADALPNNWSLVCKKLAKIGERNARQSKHKEAHVDERTKEDTALALPEIACYSTHSSAFLGPKTNMQKHCLWPQPQSPTSPNNPNSHCVRNHPNSHCVRNPHLLPSLWLALVN